MPGLIRKVVVFAALDGLIIQPLAQKGIRPAPSTVITYQDRLIAQVPSVGGDGLAKGFEAFGVVGLLTVSKASFLITITKRQQVAQIQGKAIYVITEVALTPLASKHEAENSIAQTRSALLKTKVEGHGLDESDTDGDEADYTASDEVEDDDTSLATDARPATPGDPHKRTSSVAENVMTKKGAYGRFAQKWFSDKGWTMGQKRNMGMSMPDSDDGPETEPDRVPSTGMDGTKEEDVIASLLPKLIRTTQVLFGSSRSFYFSYDHDITRSLSMKRTSNSELPLHTEVDPLFFWNRNVIQPFIDAGQHSLVLPLMMGFVGQRSFVMDTHPPESLRAMDGSNLSAMELSQFASDDSPDQQSPSGSVNTKRSFLLTLISRRSNQRAGLRYLRRGIDENGHPANSVETEQILSDAAWNPSRTTYSFVQIRGSIPIFFSQSPYSFKPIPQIQHSDEKNFQAFKAHISRICERYGKIQVASLVEKHNAEAIVGEKYQEMVEKLNQSASAEKVAFEWFDFHAACRGMKFENVSLLMDSIGAKLDAFNETIELDGKLVSRQSGVLRTNCMDCLDRTNVVQSACGRRALEVQLKNEGIEISAQADQTVSFFNEMWADNGDAVSKQYASTAAMKGDFTRTRKRNLGGALTDMGLSISRFYSGIVNDYFSQAAIDFLLGNVSFLVFEDFEANMMSGDPGISVQKMRQQAIDVCQKLVVEDETEELLGGWTFLTPQISNTIKSTPFEEAVLLLTDAAIYVCRFDWNIEKVSKFDRVDLRHVSGIRYGTYITSTLSPRQADEMQNVGLVISYKVGQEDVTRINNRSMSAAPTAEDGGEIKPTPTFLDTLVGPRGAVTRLIALKALPSRSAVTASQESPKLSEIDFVKGICAEIERMVLMGQVVEVGEERTGIVEPGDIISLAEAKKSTGLLEQLGHSLKKLVWA